MPTELLLVTLHTHQHHDTGSWRLLRKNGINFPKQSELHLWIISVVYPSNRKGITKSLGGVYWTEEMLIATEHNTGYVSS